MRQEAVGRTSKKETFRSIDVKTRPYVIMICRRETHSIRYTPGYIFSLSPEWFPRMISTSRNGLGVDFPMNLFFFYRSF